MERQILNKVTGSSLREYLGDPHKSGTEPKELRKIIDMKIPKIKQFGVSDQPTPILKDQIGLKMQLMICITHFNEDYSQLVESLVGVYRNYYELCQTDGSFENSVSVVIISDGFDTFDSVVTKKKVKDAHNRAKSSIEEVRLADQLARAGIYDEAKIAKKYAFTKTL